MSTAEILPISSLARSLAGFLDPTSQAGEMPIYIARRGRLDGVVLRLDVWEELRDQATLAIDLAERDELVDRADLGTVETGTLGEMAAPLEPSMILQHLPMQAVPHVLSDIATAARQARDVENLSGFLAHFARGYLRGTPITDPSRPGAVLEREVAPAYHDGQMPFRLVWARSGEHREIRTLVAVRSISGPTARAWTFAPPMDASEEEGRSDGFVARRA